MDKNALKIELIQKIIACNDHALLEQMEKLLQGVEVEANDPGENYEVGSSKSIVSDQIYSELEEDFQDYQKGEIKTESWEKVERELKQKYGL